MSKVHTLLHMLSAILIKRILMMKEIFQIYLGFFFLVTTKTTYAINFPELNYHKPECFESSHH